MAFWKKKIKKNLLIDIGTSCIKILLSEGPIYETLKILDYRYVHLASKSKKISSSELSVILKQTLKTLDYNNENVRAILSTKQNVVRIIELPVGSNEEIKKTASYQLGRHVPFSHENTVFDCSPLPDSVSDSGMQKCMLVAVRRSEMQSNTEILDRVGLVPMLLNTEPVSIINAYLAFKESFNKELKIISNKDDCVALVHFGSSHTDLSIISGNVPVACRAIDFGHEIKTVNQKHENKDSKAELEDSEIEKFIDKTSSEINTFFKFCQRNFELKVVRIYISGGLANNILVSNYLKEQSGIETYRYNPFISAEFDLIDKRKSDFDNVMSAFVPLVGLAVRKLKF